MTFFNKKPVADFKNDNLWLARIISLELFDTKLAKIILNLISFGIITLTLIQTYLFLKKFDGLYFIKYGAVYTGSLFVKQISLKPTTKTNFSLLDFIVN